MGLDTFMGAAGSLDLYRVFGGTALLMPLLGLIDSLRYKILILKIYVNLSKARGEENAGEFFKDISDMPR